MSARIDLAKVAEMDGAEVRTIDRFDRIVIAYDGEKPRGMSHPNCHPTHSDWKWMAHKTGMSIPELKKFTAEVASQRHRGDQ